MYKDKTLAQYLDDLAKKSPAPGGGSASAMAGALGAGLLSMVINFTLGKPKYAQYESEMSAFLKDSERIRMEFLKLVDEDVEAYLSKDIERSLAVPLSICRLCDEISSMCPVLCKHANINLISDVAVAIDLLYAAFQGAYWNVDINLKVLNDQARAKDLRQELDGYSARINAIRNETEVLVGKAIRG
ncbi:MAG: cyclodeaminase/cyclohydrolase family protein [Candidatus Omnitrophica bacterium]|jgi:formiminotetrahydrofolate cyclodeaminase|nr:cyclodeaminase/cyclohydrolase family protein [Candidatus Omnitrophota bacterium]